MGVSNTRDIPRHFQNRRFLQESLTPVWFWTEFVETYLLVVFLKSYTFEEIIKEHNYKFVFSNFWFKTCKSIENKHAEPPLSRTKT